MARCERTTARLQPWPIQARTEAPLQPCHINVRIRPRLHPCHIKLRIRVRLRRAVRRTKRIAALAAEERALPREPHLGNRNALKHRPKMGNLAHAKQIATALFPFMWKSRPQPRIKPVIARDTTCSVSLLTGTICGSNFAIPSSKFRLTGMGRNSRVVKGNRGSLQARGDLAPSAGGKGSGARASRSVSPAPETLTE